MVSPDNDPFLQIQKLASFRIFMRELIAEITEGMTNVGLFSNSVDNRMFMFSLTVTSAARPRQCLA